MEKERDRLTKELKSEVIVSHGNHDRIVVVIVKFVGVLVFFFFYYYFVVCNASP